jgi:hypothetical protein
VATRRLEEPRGSEPESDPACYHCPGLSPSEILGVGEKSVTVVVAQVATDPVGVLRKLVRRVRWALLALLAQRVAH